MGLETEHQADGSTFTGMENAWVECMTAEFSLWGGLLVGPGFCLSPWLEMKHKYLNRSLKCEAGFIRQEQSKEPRDSLHMMSTMQTLLHCLPTFPSSPSFNTPATIILLSFEWAHLGPLSGPLHWLFSPSGSPFSCIFTQPDLSCYSYSAQMSFAQEDGPWWPNQK